MKLFNDEAFYNLHNLVKIKGRNLSIIFVGTFVYSDS